MFRLLGELNEVAVDVECDCLADQLHVQPDRSLASARRCNDSLDAHEGPAADTDMAALAKSLYRSEGWINRKRLANLVELMDEHLLRGGLDDRDDVIRLEQVDTILGFERDEELSREHRFLYHDLAPLVDLGFAAQGEIVLQVSRFTKLRDLLLASRPQIENVPTHVGGI